MHLHSYNLYCLEELKQDSVLFKNAIQIHSLGNVVVDSIMKLKADLLKEAGFSSTSTSFDEKTRSLVNSFFESRGQDLHAQLNALTDSITKIDATAIKELNLKNYLSLPNTKPDTSAANFTKSVFSDVTPLAALALLSQFENKILLIENSYLTYNLDKLKGNN